MENDFRGLDLNLLVVFNALMSERNVSRAAEKLFLGQPAVSNSLARLRTVFGDELFVRVGGEMVPTKKATDLHSEIYPALQQIHAAIFEPQGFNPATDTRVFTLGMRDWVEAWIMPLLLEKLEKLAPRIRIRVQVANDTVAASLFEENEIDFAITKSIEGPKWLNQQPLTTLEYVAIYDKTSIDFGDEITLDEFVSVPHLMTSTKGDFSGSVDRCLAQSNKTRDVIYTTTRFNALPHILKQIKAIATIPEPVARSWVCTYGLKVTKLPFILDKFDLTLMHHEKNTNDQAFVWMKSLIASMFINSGT